MRASNTATPKARSSRSFWRIPAFFPVLVLASALGSGPAQAQQPSNAPAGNTPRQAPAQPTPTKTPDLWITVFSEPGKDLAAVAYNADVPSDRIKQDFTEVATKLGIGSPKVKITREAEIPVAEGELTGLADWRTGAINLDPLIQTFKRYGSFRVSFFFLGTFPEQQVLSFNQPPLRVEGERKGNTLHYRVEIDQSNGVPQAVPVVTGASQDGGRRLLLGLVAVAAVVAVAVFLVVYVILGQRRRQASGLPGRPAGQPGSAASGSTGEGKSI